MKDKHDTCTNQETCLCADNNHGVKIPTLKDGVKVIEIINGPGEYETALRDSEYLKKLLDDGRGNNSEEYTIKEIAKLLILSDHVISLIEIKKTLKEWCVTFGVSDIDIDSIIKVTIETPDIFSQIKEIAFNLGQRKKEIVFDKSQLIETAFWLMGRYFIKRVELTGELLFFNDNYYEKNADALIRRNARRSLIKSKNGDINEIVKYIEDSCQIITSEDIEKSVHLKCLLNGVYDIKKGDFDNKFSPDHIILNQIPHNYNENIEFGTISQRVSEIIPNDEDRQSYFDFASTCLHPYTGIDFQLGCVGVAGTAKSKLTTLLQLTFGSENVTNATIHSIAKDPTTQKDIAYSFLNIDEELKSDDVTNIEILKKWITQGRMTARSIYGHNTNFRPTARLMFVTNGIYEIANPDDALAMYERTHLLKLTEKFRGTEKEIKNVIEIIDEIEFDGFITYLLKNATEIFNKKKIKYPQSTQQTESLWNEYGNDIQNFIDSWLIKDVGLKEQASEIWNRFFIEQSANSKLAKSRNHFYEKFNEIIGSTAIQIRDGEDRYWGYLGFKLRTVDEKTIQEKIDQTPKGKLIKIIQKMSADSPKFEELLRLLS